MVNNMPCFCPSKTEFHVSIIVKQIPECTVKISVKIFIDSRSRRKKKMRDDKKLSGIMLWFLLLFVSVLLCGC